MKILALRILLLSCSTFCLAPLSAQADDWQYYQHDPTHTGDSSAIVNPSALTLAWSAPPGYSTPLIVGDSIYGTLNGGGTGQASTISSFARSSGAINWSYSGNFVFPSQAAVGGGFVVFHGGVSGNGSGQLYVLNANTGAFLYNVAVPGGIDVMPTIVSNPVTGAVTAYCADGSSLRAVSLGATSGSVVWTQTGSFGGSSLPTVVGSSIVMAGPGQYYAFDQTTGTANHFHAGDVSGGGGVTVAYDAARRQFYVLEDYSGNVGNALTAYHYTDNGHIEMVWQKTGVGIGNGGSVAIGADGKVYAADMSRIVELDPTTGATLRFISGSFANGMTPALTNGVLWAFSGNQTVAYDLNSLQLLRALSGSRGSLNSAYDSPGAFADGYFALDYGTIVGSHGFDVYDAPVPEPQTIMAFAVGGAFLLAARWRRR